MRIVLIGRPAGKRSARHEEEGVAAGLVRAGHLLLRASRESPPAAAALRVRFAAGRPSFEPAQRLYVFQPQAIHLVGLADSSCRIAVALVASLGLPLAIHLPEEAPDGDSEDWRLFCRLRDADAARELLPPLPWSRLRASWSEAGSELHPLFAALALRLAASFAGRRGPWLDPADPRPFLLPGDAGEPGDAVKAASAASPALRPAAAPPPRGLFARLSAAVPIPTTAGFLGLVQTLLLDARASASPVRHHAAAEIHRMLRLLMAREKRSFEPFRFLAAKKPADEKKAPPVESELSPAALAGLLASARVAGTAADSEGAGRVKVLALVPSLALGGAEHQLFESIRELAESHAFVVATLEEHAPRRGDRRADFAALAPVYSLREVGRPEARPELVAALIERHAIEVVYGANGCDAFYEIAKKLRPLDPAVAWLDHLYDHSEGYFHRYRGGARPPVDLCLAENRRIAEALAAEGWPGERIRVVPPCGRRPADLPGPAERAALRAERRAGLGLGDGDLLALCAARLHPQKRPFDLLALAQRLRDTRWNWLLVGGGELEAEIDAEIAAAAPGLRFTRLPFSGEVPEWIAAADLGCLVSDYEGLPVFLIECLQLGVPFLSTDVGGIAEVLAETGAGRVVARGDLAALEAALRRLADDEVRAPLAERAAAAAPHFGTAERAQAAAAAFTAARELRALP